MKLGKLTRVALAALGFSLSLSVAACSRDHIEAIKAMNQGDNLVKISADNAIAKYKEAAQLDPSNHMILWKLSKAQAKKEDWEGMAGTLSQAIGKAPEFANYSEKRGYALIKAAEEDKNNTDLYEQAVAPLKKCVETDPNRADCYHLLGVAYNWTDEPQQALDYFTKAIEHDPTKAFYYVEPAELYLALRKPGEAAQLLEAGVELIPRSEDNREGIFSLNVALAKAYQAKGERAKMLPVLEDAKKLDAKAKKHPEVNFYLGSFYAKQQPPNATKAIQYLEKFKKRGCKGPRAQIFKAQCVQADTFVQLLGGLEN